MEKQRSAMVIPFLMVLLATLLLFACGCSKLNQDNYDQLKMGMVYDEVISILGDPDDCSSALGMTNCLWGSDKKFIQVHFMAEKVVFFSAQGL